MNIMSSLSRILHRVMLLMKPIVTVKEEKNDKSHRHKFSKRLLYPAQTLDRFLKTSPESQDFF